MSHLQADKITIQFGGLTAVEDFSMDLREHELVGLIGPNGAGKTTIFNMFTGVYKPTKGSITLDGKSLASRVSSQIVRLGMSRTFQNIRLFKTMTVLENIKVALHHEATYTIVDAILRTPKYHAQEKLIDEKAHELLSIFKLDKYAHGFARGLSYGNQRKLEITRALATNPKVLLLDEPAAGMNPQETQELMDTILYIKNRFDVSILLIEHDMKLVMGICERIIVMDHGKMIASGAPELIRRDPLVIKAYLGG